MDWKDQVRRLFIGTMNCNIIKAIVPKPGKKCINRTALFVSVMVTAWLDTCWWAALYQGIDAGAVYMRKVGPGTRGTSPSRANLGEPTFPKISSTVYVRNCKFERRVTRSVNLGGEPILLRANSSRYSGEVATWHRARARWYSKPPGAGPWSNSFSI